MIRLIQRRLIIPRGDTGSFSIPVLSKGGTDNIAVFTIFDEITRTKMFQKIISGEGDVLTIAFTHNDTVNLKPGKYVWDIKYYKNPEYIDDELVNGEEIDSYYAGFSLPVCEIRETADNYLVSPEAPTATLSPEQLEIVTGAIHSLNEAIRKTQENVEHYPEIRDEVWYVWDAELGDYVSTGVSANGIVGNGIASAVLNNDYTLTLNFTDGTSFTSPSIRGQKGNGIDDIVLNNNFTLTISYTDGGSYTTPSIRGPIGPTPQFSIGTVQDGAVAAASVTGTAENPVLNLTLPNANVPTALSQLLNDVGYLTQHQDLSDYVQKTDYATTNNAGVVKVDSSYTGINIASDGTLRTNPATSFQIKAGASGYQPLQPGLQHTSTFYGLAKAAGDTTQSQSSNAVGTYTNEAKSAIQQMLDVPSTADIPTQVSELTNDAGYLTTETDPTVPAWAKAAQKPTYTASEVGAPTVAEMNTAIGTAIGQINSFDIAVVQALPTQDISTHTIYLVPKTGETNDVYDEYLYINNNWEMVGNTQIDLSNYVQKTDYATANVAGVVKTSASIGILSTGEIGVIPATNAQIKAAIDGNNPIMSSRQHASTFYGLAKAAGDSTQSASSNAVGTYTDEAKAAIQQMLDVPSTGDIPNVPVQDVQVNGTSVLNNGIANVDAVIVPDTGIGSAKTRNFEYNGQTFSNEASGRGAFVEGSANIASGNFSHAEGVQNKATGGASHVEGQLNVSLGARSHAEGYQTFAFAGAHAEGGSTAAFKSYAHVEGLSTSANGDGAHAEGEGIILNIFLSGSNGIYTCGSSLVEKYDCIIYNDTSYLISDVDEENQTISISLQDVLENVKVKLYKTNALGRASHTEGFSTQAASNYQHVQGKYNIADYQNTYADIIGNGTAPTKRSNAYALDWEGNGHFAGDVYVGANADSSGGTKLAKITDIPEVPVQDVQVNSVSVLQGGVANVPIASGNTFGVAKIDNSLGITITSAGKLSVQGPNDTQIKASTVATRPLTPYCQHASTFYGLSKVAGVDLANETVTLGTYPETSKTAIKAMLGIQDGSTGTVDISGTTPTITAVENTRYVCGEVTSISFTPAASGICIVRFTSGSTVTVLTLPNTVKFPEWFDPTSLETNTIYEICITDGVYGAVMSWAL